MFQVGQRVVCVCDSWEEWTTGLYGIACPVAGREYTIRAIDPSNTHGILALRFHELVNPKWQFTDEYGEPRFCAFNRHTGAANFRPVIEKKLPESLTRLLTPDLEVV